MNSATRLEEEYFNWLLERVKGRKYFSLCQQLHNTEFVWFVPNDDNRDEDGRELRLKFQDRYEMYGDAAWMFKNASIFELIVGICYRLTYDSDIDIDYWFWKIIDNLNLLDHSDDRYNGESLMIINKATQRINNRTYKPNGDGGLFPLRHADQDQRKVEIWYQMSTYLLENNTTPK